MRRSGRSRSERSRSSKPSSSPTTAKRAEPALYIHVPFCVTRCGYCDFYSVADAEQELVDRFLYGLELEVAALAEKAKPETVYLGGGTPTHLDEARLERLLVGLRSRVDLSACLEVSCEANPESVTATKLSLLADAGVTRLSLGVQSFDPEALRFLERAHGVSEVGRAYDLVVASNIPELSLDLIFGLPGQELRCWARDLEAAIALNPFHISCYNLTIEPGTPFDRARRRAQWEELDASAALELFRETRNILGEAGYEAYEVSNFAREGRLCRHNLNYWQAGDYLGLGPSASSHRRGCRSSNLRHVAAYVDALEATGCASAEAEILSPECRAGEALWLGLRLEQGVDGARILELTGVDPAQTFEAEIRGQLEAGWLAQDGPRLWLTTAGLPHADALGSAFLPTPAAVPRGTSGEATAGVTGAS